MGEGMAIGFDGLERGTVVGTRMAGLAGAIDDMTLPCSRLVVGFATARLLHVNGTPREAFHPEIEVQERESSEDIVLNRALVHLRSTAPRTGRP
jgi:hypothetical protein